MDSIPANKLSISQATVSIKMVQVDNKKMTLALFRQIPIYKHAYRESMYETLSVIAYGGKLDIPVLIGNLAGLTLLGRIDYDTREKVYRQRLVRYWVLAASDWFRGKENMLVRFPVLNRGVVWAREGDADTLDNLEQLYIAV